MIQSSAGVRITFACVISSLVLYAHMQFIHSSYTFYLHAADWKRLKKWFYGGFKKRMNLSRRKISSTGQKLPLDWKQKHEKIVSRVVKAQMPRQRRDGSFQPGVTDDKMANTDQVPVYIESFGNYQWGRKEDHGRRMVATAGQEKNRFTTQLTCFKDGRKVCIYHISIIFLSYLYCMLSSFSYYVQYIHNHIPSRGNQ